MKTSMRGFVLRMMILCAALILAVTLILTGVLFRRSNEVLSSNSASLIATAGRQIEINITNYLEKVENTAALLFSDTDYYTYDATDPSLEEYDRIQREKKIEDEIVNIGMMENFADFGVVYRNDSTVGWISQVTLSMFPSGGMYEEFIATISDEETLDGWSFGHKDNFERLYYVKQLNPNALLLASFYSAELESVFTLPEQLDEVEIRLVDTDDRILYSVRKEEVGGVLPETIAGLSAGERVSLNADGEQLVTTNRCSNGWRVVCSVEIRQMLRDNIQLRNYALSAAMLVALSFLAAAIILSRRLSRPVVGMVDTLHEQAEHDPLSGLLNRNGFLSVIEGQESSAGAVSFIMMDIDNFKQVNDSRGHDAGDQVISRMSRVLTEVFPDQIPICRLGGDEFAVWMTARNGDIADAEKTVSAFVLRLFEAFRNEFGEEIGSLGISLSVGVCTAPGGEDGYEMLYKRADEALYESKHKGKDRATYVN